MEAWSGQRVELAPLRPERGEERIGVGTCPATFKNARDQADVELGNAIFAKKCYGVVVRAYHGYDCACTVAETTGSGAPRSMA